jgi:hypothetical protein
MTRTAISLFVVLMLSTYAVGAAGLEAIVTERRAVSDIGPGAEPLKARLVAEVQKVIKAGRLAPFRTLYGEHGLRYHWREPWQMPYTLGLALPHLPPELQADVKRYLAEEIAARPPWEGALLGPDGTKRQPDDLPESVFRAIGAGQTPTAFFPYALWVYASRSGDWRTIRANWPVIQQNFQAKVGTRPNFETASGAIGMYRLAVGIDDSAAAARFLKAATDALAACRNFEAVRASAHRAYTGHENWTRESHGVNYAFFNLTPEIARLIAGDEALAKAAEAYADAGRRTWPLWWMAQAPVGDWGYYGEGCCAGPEQRGMLFNYEAWVRKLPAEQLAMYADVADALIGDCTYMQNLVTAIEAFGTAAWTARDGRGVGRPGP